MSDGRVLAITGAVCFVLGGIALTYAVSLGLAAHEFNSAAVCSAGIEGADCLQRRAIQITSTGTGRFGEVNTVDFLDDGNPHESHLGPGRYDTSVLVPGASGTVGATLPLPPIRASSLYAPGYTTAAGEVWSPEIATTC